MIMTHEEAFKEIRSIVEKITELGLPKIFIEAAKGKTKEEMEDFIKKFKEEHPCSLWKEMDDFYENYSSCQFQVFYVPEEGIENPENTILYNPDEINPISLCILTTLSDETANDNDLFGDYYETPPISKYVKEYGEYTLGEFLEEYFLDSIDDFVDAVNGRRK